MPRSKEAVQRRLEKTREKIGTIVVNASRLWIEMSMFSYPFTSTREDALNGTPLWFEESNHYLQSIKISAGALNAITDADFIQCVTEAAIVSSHPDITSVTIPESSGTVISVDIKETDGNDAALEISTTNLDLAHQKLGLDVAKSARYIKTRPVQAERIFENLNNTASSSSAIHGKGKIKDSFSTCLSYKDKAFYLMANHNESKEIKMNVGGCTKYCLIPPLVNQLLCDHDKDYAYRISILKLFHDCGNIREVCPLAPNNKSCNLEMVNIVDTIHIKLSKEDKVFERESNSKCKDMIRFNYYKYFNKMSYSEFCPEILRDNVFNCLKSGGISVLLRMYVYSLRRRNEPLSNCELIKCLKVYDHAKNKSDLFPIR